MEREDGGEGGGNEGGSGDGEGSLLLLELCSCDTHAAPGKSSGPWRGAWTRRRGGRSILNHPARPRVCCRDWSPAVIYAQSIPICVRKQK